MATETIKDGDYLIVKTESILRLVELKKNRPQYLGKRKANLFAALGHPFGTFFEIKSSDGSLTKLENPKDAMNLLVQVSQDADIKDNRDLIDKGGSQNLTSSDIEAFKKQGMSGQDMVMKIVENSNTFHEKTAFAKEKYLRKKQKKYLNYVQLLKPNVRLLAEMYYMQGPLKICNLRIDSLSQMLTFCNVMSGGRYMVIDTALGLLTAAVLERLGTLGCAVQLHLGPFSIYPNQQVIKALNIPQAQLDSIFYNIDFKSVISMLSIEGDAMMVDGQPIKQESVDSPQQAKNEPELPIEEDAMMVDGRPTKQERDDSPQKEKNKSVLSIEEDAMMLDGRPIKQKRDDIPQRLGKKAKLLANNKTEKQEHIQKAKDILIHKNMDGLLIAIRNHPANALQLLDFLAFSRPFAIFSMFQGPLVDCYVQLKARGDIISLNLTETWLRKYQVLPNRTHPDYNMSGSGGYLLTGIKVEAKPQV